MSAMSPARTSAAHSVARPHVESTTISLTIAALATMIMLQSMRVFVSYLVVVIGQANRTTLEVVTLGVFLAVAAAPLLLWLVGLRATTIFMAAGIALTRAAMQFWTQPNARLIMAAAVIVLWGWLTVSLLGLDRHTLALGLLLGFVLDTGIRIAFLSLDLPWNSGAVAAAVTIATTGLLLVTIIPFQRMKIEQGGARGISLSLIAIGPGLAMFHLVGSNLGLAQTKTGLGFASAASLLSLGLVVGVFGSLLLERESGRNSVWMNLTERALVVVVGAIALWLFWTNDAIAPLALPLVTAVNLILVGSAIWSGLDHGERNSPVMPAIWFTLGLLLQVGILFYYYDASGRTLYMVLAAILLAAGSLVGAVSPTTTKSRRLLPMQSAALVATPVLLLAAVCGWQFVGESNPTTGQPLAGTFTVMTYNLQDGFAADNSFDLEAQADTISEARPDVVVLQEVSRGWLVTSGADEALWLSHRLDMPIYFGGNSDDGLWGNAILTRAPVSDVQQLHFTVTKNLKRGTIEAKVPTENGDFWVVGTHLDNPKDADAIRLEQANQLIDNLDSRHPAVVMGDFNVDPGSEVLSTFSQNGLSDPGETFLSGVTTTTDQRRLDYILVSGDVSVESMEAIDSTASDHKPVTAVLSLTPK